MSLRGDATYDLAKVYQSLMGYNFFFNKLEMIERDHHLLHYLGDTFLSYVSVHYSQIKEHDIMMMTDSLFFSVISLHNNETCQKHFFGQFHKILGTLFLT